MKNNNTNKKESKVDLDKMDLAELRSYAALQAQLVDALAAENDELIVAQEKFQEKSDGYITQLSNLKNDFENLKRRSINTAEMAVDDGKIFVLEKIIPILDTFERGEEALKGKEDWKAFSMIHRQFEKVLKESGLVEINVIGLDFNPETAHALTKEEAGEENVNKVLEVLSKGYKYKDKIIRFATVKVGV